MEGIESDRWSNDGLTVTEVSLWPGLDAMDQQDEWD